MYYSYFSLVKRIALILSFLYGFAGAHAQPEAHNQFATFYSTEQGPYIETAFVVIGNSLFHKQTENGSLQAKILVTEIFKSGGEIVDFKKYELFGPEISDSIFLDFMNQERFALNDGYYNYELTITDLYSIDSLRTTVNDVVHIKGAGNDLMASTLELVQANPEPTTEITSYSKAGYEIIPLIYDYYPTGANSLAFYIEIYNSDLVLGDTTQYLITYHIEDFSTAQVVGQFRQFAKMETEPVNVLMKGFNIESLPTGTYSLVFELRDQNNELLVTKQHRFFRFNEDLIAAQNDLAEVDVIGTFAESITDADTLREILYAHHPISEALERTIIEEQIEIFDLESMQQFLYTIWVKRMSEDPKGGFLNYMEQVKLVDEMFGTKVREGYETDRGRVYLQYGTPNSVTDRPNEPSSYPYQIWQYYKAGEYSNKKFIFYNPDLVTNDYVLLHSDMYGEIRNDRWELVLNSRNNPTDNIYDTEPQDQFGGNSNDYWTNPR